jgi:hypothetical protein
LIWFKEKGRREVHTRSPAASRDGEMQMTGRTPTASPGRRVRLGRFFAAGCRVAAFTLLLALPMTARAATLRLDWTLGFSYPPNPCVAGSTLASRSLGLFMAASGGVGYTPLVPEQGLPGLSCGASGSGTVGFDAADGVVVFGAYAGALRFPDPGAAERPVYAFPTGTAEGELLVDIDPGAAPYLRLGEVCGSLFCPDAGLGELPLFAFAGAGMRIGTLSMAVTTVPEPAPWALMLWAGAAGWAGLRRRTHSHAAARLRR